MFLCQELGLFAMINMSQFFFFIMHFLLKKKHDIFYVLFYGQKANFPWEKEIYSQYINWLWKQQEGCGGIYRNTPNGEHSSAKSNGPAQKHSPIFTTHFFTFLLENCRFLRTFFYLFQSYLQKIPDP